MDPRDRLVLIHHKGRAPRECLWTDDFASPSASSLRRSGSAGRLSEIGRSESPKTIKFPLERRGFGIRLPRNQVINDGANGQKSAGSKHDGGASFPCSRAPRARTMHGPGSPAWGSTRHTPAPHLPAYLPSVRAGSPTTVSNTNPPVFGLPSASPHSRPSGRTRVLKGRTCRP